MNTCTLHCHTDLLQDADRGHKVQESSDYGYWSCVQDVDFKRHEREREVIKSKMAACNLLCGCKYDVDAEKQNDI